MSAEDMALNTTVRGVIAGFSVDDSQLYVSSRAGIVALRGKLSSRMDSKKPLNSGTIRAMEEAILNQKGVKKVAWQLDNWKMVGMKWIEE